MEDHNTVEKKDNSPNYNKYLIVIVIILSLIFIAGKFIYHDKSKVNIVEMEHGDATAEDESFNSFYYEYSGNQSGSQVKALITRLIENANTYVEEPEKIPSICYDNGLSNTSFVSRIEIEFLNEDSLADYVNVCDEISNSIESEQTYVVTMNDDSESEIINKIVIKKE